MAADGVIAVTPVFSGSFSGLFKTFIDVLERDALDGAPVVVAATGGSARHSLAVDTALRPLFAYLRAAVMPTGVFAATDDWGDPDQAGPLAMRIERASGELAARSWVAGAMHPRIPTRTSSPSTACPPAAIAGRHPQSSRLARRARVSSHSSMR